MIQSLLKKKVLFPFLEVWGGGRFYPLPISEGPKCDLYLLKESISHMCDLLTFNPFLTRSSIHKTFVFLVHLLAYTIDIEYISGSRINLQ